MPKAPPRPSTQRDCRFDFLVGAAVERGHGQVLKYTGIETVERGHEIRRGLYRCAKHREISMDAGPSRLVSGDDPDEMGLRPVGDEYELWFRTWSKSGARARHIKKYGTDRSQWPYDPRRAKSQEDIDYWASMGLNEKGHKLR
jgi:hypothetical protein